MWNLSANAQGDPPRSGGDAVAESMITSRRNFLKTATFGSASLVIGFDGLRLLKGANTETNLFKPSNWIQIDADGAISLTIGKCGTAQGVRASLSVILAEELEADWAKIRLVQAKPSAGSDLGTGGSDSIASSWKPLRKAGAAAREMLIMAAAARWKVDPASCSADRGEVVHRPSDRRVAYGSLVSEAAKLPVPNDPALKNASEFKIIGQPTARIDGPDIVCGKAQYGIDVKLPGMLYASLERPPFSGAKVKQIQEDKARAVYGVHSIITLPRGIAVIADNTWAAIKGRATLAVEWDDPSR